MLAADPLRFRQKFSSLCFFNRHTIVRFSVISNNPVEENVRYREFPVIFVNSWRRKIHRTAKASSLALYIIKPSFMHITSVLRLRFLYYVNYTKLHAVALSSVFRIRIFIGYVIVLFGRFIRSLVRALL